MKKLSEEVREMNERRTLLARKQREIGRELTMKQRKALVIGGDVISNDGDKL